LNPRILANLADVQKKLGKDKEAFENMKRAARASMSPAVFLDLGVDFLHRKDTSKSIEMFKRALQIDSMFGGAHANLAIVYYACHNYKLAAFHGSKGINYGVTNPVFYKITGNAFLLLNDVQQALKYYDVYLKQKPNDVEIKTVRNKIMQGLPKRN
jgi:tetratricopeptide (TPR) repeat protein